MPINDLISSLISYEKHLAAEKGIEEKKKKYIALKASKHERDEKSELADKDMTMMAMSFRNFF